MSACRNDLMPLPLFSTPTNTSCGRVEAKGSICVDPYHVWAEKQTTNFLISLASALRGRGNEQISHSKPKVESLNRQEM